ncbi:MAG: chloride channel protein [Methanomassiliicoccales archaeon]
MQKDGGDFIAETRIARLSLISAGIGVVAGFIAYALYHLIGLITNIFFYGRISDSFVAPDHSPFGPLVIILPAIGGLLAGLMIKYGSPKIIGHGIPEAMEAVIVDKSKIEPKVGLLKAVSGAVTIGTGQPFGAEGPIIQTGGAFGSFVGQTMKISAGERNILLSAGAAAGMAAVFGTPIAAVLLSIELLLFQFRVRTLVPVVIASAIGGAMHVVLIQAQPLFQTPAYNFGNLYDLILFVPLGLVCGVAAYLLSHALYRTESVFTKIPLGQPWLPAVGGLFVGVIGFFVPQIFGVGYNIIEDLLTGRVLVLLALSILIAKSVAWTLAMGSRTSGGTLAPFFMIGAAIGLLYGMLIRDMFPSLGLAAQIFAIAGLGAVFGSAARAPLTCIAFALEVTGDYSGAIAVMLTIISADLVTEYLMDSTLMTEKLYKRGLRIRHQYDYNPLMHISLSRIMERSFVNADVCDSVREVRFWLSKPSEVALRSGYVLVSKKGKVTGIVTLGELFDAGLDERMEIGSLPVASFITMPSTSFAYDALVQLIKNSAKYVIVTNDAGLPCGIVSEDDFMLPMKNRLKEYFTAERFITLFGKRGDRD